MISLALSSTHLSSNPTLSYMGKLNSQHRTYLPAASSLLTIPTTTLLNAALCSSAVIKIQHEQAESCTYQESESRATMPNQTGLEWVEKTFGLEPSWTKEPDVGIIASRLRART